MALYILMGFAALCALFFVYIGTRKGTFKYEIKETFNAEPSKVFPFLSDFNLGSQWSPYEKADSSMKKQIVGEPNKVGGKFIFSGNKETGSGSLEFLKIVPNEQVEIRLIMTAPLKAENLVCYSLKKVPDGTEFTWSMEGDGGYLGKFITFFVDCEKIVIDQFRKGMTNLKPLVESN